MSLNDSLRQVIPYVSNIKAAVGILMIGFSLYTGFTDIPPKWDAYNKSGEKEVSLNQNLKNLSAEEAKLKRISEELDKVTTKLVEVPKGLSPDLTLIKVAQKVADLAEKSKNVYLSLVPGETVSINVDNAVTLAVNAPAPDAAAAAPSTPPAEGQAAAPAPQASPAPAAGASNILKSYRYTLNVKGSYATLSDFIEEFCKQPEFMIIKDLSLSSEDKQIKMELSFLIPWIEGAAAPPPPPAATEEAPAAAADATKPTANETSDKAKPSAGKSGDKVTNAKAPGDTKVATESKQPAPAKAEVKASPTTKSTAVKAPTKKAPDKSVVREESSGLKSAKPAKVKSPQ